MSFLKGVVWPALMAFWPSWVNINFVLINDKLFFLNKYLKAPPAERGTILGFASAGSQIGNVITLPLGGFLCENGFDGGWASIFYVIGMITYFL